VRVGYLIDTMLARRDGPPGPADLDALVEEGILAERAGFHSVHVPDRHGAPACAFPGPEQLLTLLARETSRVMLGSFTFVATLVHPMKAAEQFAVIDQLSRGRLVTTVSRGFLPQFWGQFGIPEEKLLGRFLEALRIWRAAFAGERFDFDGRHWQVRDGLLAPAPFQPGGWPLWGGGNASPGRSAEYAEAWTTDPLPGDLRPNLERYAARARELGKRPFVVAMRDGWVADSRAEAERVFGEHYERMTRFYLRQGLPGAASGPGAILGTPEECIAQLEGLGVDYVVFCCRLSTGPSLEAAREQILRFGEEVVQPIHARSPAPKHPAIPVNARR
jgi:alkanesulfonate monooxygenase SsuD/methylene tetrahydromethanopterin reductase-like flavin-dependent oxidoreductase (luciferase family)